MSLPSNFVNNATRLALYKRDNFTCAFCGKKLERNHRNLTLDHIVARSQDGSHDEHNLITACHSCNSRKQSMTVWEFCVKMDFNFLEVDNRIRQNTNKVINPFMSQALEVLENNTYLDALQII